MTGKTLNDFKKAHDRKAALRDRIYLALAQLGDAWEYEGEFRLRAGLSNPEWASLRDEYVKNIVEVKGSHGRGSNGHQRRAVAGTAKFANKLREALKSG
jgi:hypothetical protein